ncbi:hypothetical protein GEMRC1_006283 [Eukaryota sp. GEM-RC1]
MVKKRTTYQSKAGNKTNRRNKPLTRSKSSSKVSSRRKEPLVPDTEELVDSSDFESDPSEDGCLSWDGCLSEDRSPTSHKEVTEISPEVGESTSRRVVDVQPEGGCPSEDGRTSSSRQDGEVGLDTPSVISDRIPSLLEK